jgi:hypothetical protein
MIVWVPSQQPEILTNHIEKSNHQSNLVDTDKINTSLTKHKPLLRVNLPKNNPLEQLTPLAKTILTTASEKYSFSARTTLKIANLSYSIAQLEFREHKNQEGIASEKILVTDQHVFEALSFRPQLAFLEE